MSKKNNIWKSGPPTKDVIYWQTKAHRKIGKTLVLIDCLARGIYDICVHGWSDHGGYLCGHFHCPCGKPHRSVIGAKKCVDKYAKQIDAQRRGARYIHSGD
jgi:hypothetical protein